MRGYRLRATRLRFYVSHAGHTIETHRDSQKPKERLTRPVPRLQSQWLYLWSRVLWSLHDRQTQFLARSREDRAIYGVVLKADHEVVESVLWVRISRWELHMEQFTSELVELTRQRRELLIEVHSLLGDSERKDRISQTANWRVYEGEKGARARIF